MSETGKPNACGDDGIAASGARFFLRLRLVPTSLATWPDTDHVHGAVAGDVVEITNEVFGPELPI